MGEKLSRIEIVAEGLVQGVGFRYFVLQKAKSLEVNGYVQNLYSGEVLTVAEGDKFRLEELLDDVKIGPRSAQVKNIGVKWLDYKNEFSTFEIR